MKKKKYILVLSIIIIILTLVLALYNKFICIYDNKEILLTQNKNITAYLKRIDYDLENGPKLVFTINGDDTKSYKVKITINNIEWVYKLYSVYGMGISNNKEFEVDLYTYYKRDLKALELEENKKNLKTKGYSLSDYKNAFSNVRNFEIKMEIYETWLDRNYDDTGRGFSTPGERKIADIHKFIKINGHDSNLIKQIYNNIDILQVYDVMQAPENVEWKSFEQIIPIEILEKIDKVVLNDNIQGNKERILESLKSKKYAIYPNRIPMYDNEKEKYKMLDNSGKEILKIVSCYISKQVGSDAVQPLETFYKIIYENSEVYCWTK